MTGMLGGGGTCVYNKGTAAPRRLPGLMRTCPLVKMLFMFWTFGGNWEKPHRSAGGFLKPFLTLRK
jgi:hypothetical protein